MSNLIKLFPLLLLFWSCQTAPKEFADSIYHNGQILTMEGNSPNYVEAVAIKNGKILQTGNWSELQKLRTDSTETFDLEGNVMLPGFIEPHLHPILATILIQTQILAFNDWSLPHGEFPEVKDAEEYFKKLDALVENSSSEKPLITWGFHDLFHGEIDRQILDNRYEEKPVVIWHYSFHELIMNSAAIELLGIDLEAAEAHPQVDLAKGRFKERGSAELGAPKLMPYLLNPKSAARGMQLTAKAIQNGGVTTVADMAMPLFDFGLEFGLIKGVLDNEQVPFRTFLIPNAATFSSPDKLAENFIAIDTLSNLNSEKIQFLKQVKLFADGAFYSQLMQMKESYMDGHEGEWLMPPPILQQYAEFFWEKDFRIHVHANGDLGVEKTLDILENLNQKTPKNDHRFTLHHLGYVAENQFERIKKLGVHASAQPYYIYTLGSKYSKHGLGEKRAQRISPIGALIENDILTCFHSDFFMAPVEPLTLMWVAVNRKTIDGKTFGRELKIDAWEALKAVTINAAYHLNQEENIGSIKVGKSADFVILDKNPLEVPSEEINEIQVLGTVFEGKR